MTTAVKTSFYSEVRQASEPIFQAIFKHPMVVELCAGTLPEQKWAYYLGQDYQYLRDFKQAMGLALVQVDTPREIFEWIERIAGLADLEAKRHLTWARRLGLSEQDLLSAEPDPMALVYRQHMLLAAHRSLGELFAALVPCPATYMEIADRAVDRIPDHPIYGDWVRSYSYLNPEIAERRPWWGRTLDRLAEDASPRELARMRTNFLRSCKYEWMFWDMAYHMRGWPV
jgi:thiaminase (transcriptional activator TenA)